MSTDELTAVAGSAAGRMQMRRGDRVVSSLVPAALAARLDNYDFDAARPITDVAGDLLDLLTSAAVRSDHPCYFGLFNPPALPAAVAGDLIAAAINPQLAVSSHAPAAAAIEDKLLRFFADRIWPRGQASGTFTSGGSEANHSALLAAVARRYPAWATAGLPRSGRRPVVYVSAGAHLAWIKIARAAGLGGGAVRLVAPADGLSLDRATLEEALDQRPEDDPVLIVATAGSTAHGAIDDLAGLAMLGRARGIHVHVDAAWAGALILDERRRCLLAGVELADSVTIDAHKWLAVPMGAGMFLTREPGALRTVFDVATEFMPVAQPGAFDPYLHSLQWSRRFTGAKLFMALACLGLDGYRAMFDRQFALGERLRSALTAAGWRILNATPLPLVCFVPEDAEDAQVRAIEQAVIASGLAWLSTARVRGRLALRACITSFETRNEDIDALVALLERARAQART